MSDALSLLRRWNVWSRTSVVVTAAGPDENLVRFSDQQIDVLELLTDETDAALAAQPAAPAQPLGNAWRCFHCNETFADAECAAQHFGRSEHSEAACQIDIEKYRAMEANLARWQLEDTDLHRTILRLESDHGQAVRRAEEEGYAKGLADGRAQLKCTACNGRGEIPWVQHGVGGGIERCMRCGGTGVIPAAESVLAVAAPARTQGNAEPVAYIWHQHLGTETKSLRWSKPGQWEYATKVEPLYAAPPPAPAWQPIETAPKDGTEVLLLIEGGTTPLSDDNLSVSIGAWTGEPAWSFAGWDWSQDEYCAGNGTPVGWMPKPAAAPPAPEPKR